VIHGPIEQGYSVLGAGFGEDVAHVVVHGAFADRQRAGDFLVGEPLGHQLNDLDLPFRDL
jgi:hypothetical protein